MIQHKDLLNEGAYSEMLRDRKLPLSLEKDMRGLAQEGALWALDQQNIKIEAPRKLSKCFRAIF
jgi:hypothetical protein